jgi:hypothetical protein
MMAGRISLSMVFSCNPVIARSEATKQSNLVFAVLWIASLRSQ